MQPALRPLYCLPIGDHCALTLRLSCGRSLDLVVYDGGGATRTVGVWRLTGRTLRVVTAAEA